ncbi:hypothetical protein OU683_01315 [Salinimicrobium sp. TH3]|nr:hypothetical protein [Salinimicrobium sp. TH3]
MKNFYMLAILSFWFMACSVEDDGLELNTNNDSELNATMECTDFLGSDNFTGSLTVRNKAGVTDIKGWTVEDLKEYVFTNLLESGVPQDGVFSPTLQSIVDKFNNGTVPQGLFTTTYTASVNGCTDSVRVGATVDGVPCTEFLGEDNLSGVLSVTDITGWTAEDLKNYLFANLLESGVPENGVFDPTLQSIVDKFNDGTVPQGLFTTTYIARVDGCPDSVKIGATIESPLPCTEFLGEDNLSGELTVRNKAGVTDIKGWTVQDLEDYVFANLLESGVPEDGVFSPTLQSLHDRFNDGTVPQGLFTTTYTATVNGCTDSVKIGATIDGKVPCTEFLGEDNLSGELTVRNRAGVTDIKGWTVQDLEDYVFANLLESGVPEDGVFSPTLQSLHDKFNDGTVPQGLFTITYTATVNGCTDSVKIGATIDGCTEFLGADNLSGKLTVRNKAGVTDIKGWTAVDLRNYVFSNLLKSDAPTNGTFNPTLQSIVDKFNNGTVPQGLFSTTYTATVNGCTDSVKVGATVD